MQVVLYNGYKMVVVAVRVFMLSAIKRSCWLS